MRGEGTRAAVSRSTAAFRAWRSCTLLFHHGAGDCRSKSQMQRCLSDLRLMRRQRESGERPTLLLQSDSYFCNGLTSPLRLLLHLLADSG